MTRNDVLRTLGEIFEAIAIHESISAAQLRWIEEATAARRAS